MKNYLIKIKVWRRARRIRKNTPLSNENAYALSSIGNSHGKYIDVIQYYHDYTLKSIKEAAKLGNSYLLQSHPDFVSSKSKEELIHFLSTLGFTICYSDNKVILISWCKY